MDNKRNKTGKTPKAPYEVSKAKIINRATKSVIRYNTSNTKPKTVDVRGVLFLMKFIISLVLKW